MSILKYITSTELTDGSLTSVSDSTNWGIDNAIIKCVYIETNSIDWNLTIYTDSNPSVGLYGIKIADSLNGNQLLLLDILYIDNDASNSIHCVFVDNQGSNSGWIEIYGEKAQI